MAEPGTLPSRSGRAPRLRRAARTATVLAAVLALAGCAQQGSDAPITGFVERNPDGMHGAVLDEQYSLPPVTLTATDGEAYRLTRDTTAPLTLVFFGYTHCPDICQVVMADIASALTRLPAEQREQVDMLFITSDPARDDAATLRAYLDRFDPSFEGLTGDLDTIVGVARALGVPIEEGNRLPSGGYEVAHGTQIVGIDERDRAPIVWTEGTSSAALAEDLVALLSATEPRSPLS